MANAVNRHSLSSVETSVLVVDDDSAKRYALVRMLSSRGLRVTEAATAAEALRSASAQQPDVVLLDVKLPDLSGFEACERIKSDPATASIPVLLVSAVFTDVLHHVHGLNRGADAYLTGDVEPEVLLATVRSLARMRHSERELRAREQRYHSLIAATASIVWSADADGNFTEPQPSWQQFTGQSEAPFASSSGYACIHPEDRDRVAIEWHQALARGHLFETGFRLWHAPTAEYRHVISRGAPVTNDDGSVREWIGTITDVHERKHLERTEAQLAAIVKGSTDAIIGTATDDTITAWNAAAERLYGYTAAEILGRSRTLLVPPDRMDELAQMLARVRRGELIEDYETVRVRKDGKRMHVAVTLSSIRDEAGHFAGTSAITRDITARKQAEEALRRSRQQLQVALEGAGLELWTCDAGTGVVQMSDQAATAMNLDAAAPAALWVDRIHPADRDRVDAALKAALQGASEYNAEYRVIDRDGSTRWISSHGKLLRDESGHPLQLVAANQDVTARRLAEEAVRESEEQFRTLANSIPQLAWITDETGFIYWYNERWYEYTGSSPEQMKGWGWKSVHDPAQLPRVIERWKEALESGEPWEDTFPLRRHDGVMRWHLSRALPIRDKQGRILRWFGTNTDITERMEAEQRIRESEERFRRLYESDIVGIVSADPERIRDANDVFLAMVGYTRQDLVEGRILWREMTPPEYLARAEGAFQELVTTGSCTPFEKQYFRKDGTRVPVLIGATLLEASPPHWLCFLVDLTERKAMERKLFEKEKLESIGLLAGGVAHDFNNLLVGILGNASLAQDLVPAGSAVRYMLNEIVSASERAAHLTRQMLAYSGKGRFVIEPVNLSEVAADVVKLVQSSISPNAPVHLVLERDLPKVAADPEQVRQVVMNLVLNAAEAMSQNPGLLSIRTGVYVVDEQFIRDELVDAEIAPGTYVGIEVRDTGPGMDDETRARIFEPFFSTKFTGRGLGLAAVSGIMRGHKGAIGVRSAPGQGSTFLALFPFSGPTQRPSGATLSGAAEQAGAGRKVLVVDDEQVVLRTTRLALERYGYTVLQANSGPAGIELLKREKDRLSLVLLDLSMPGMNGQQTLAEMRKITPSLDVIVLSGYSEAESREVFAGHAISGFIQKPYRPAELVQLVNSVRTAHVPRPAD